MSEPVPSTGKPLFVLLAGFGLPGRSVAERLRNLAIPFRIIEKNPETVSRAAAAGWPIQVGDALESGVLRQAGIEHADIFGAMMPDETDVLRCVQLARNLNSKVRIIARCSFMSGGLEAIRRGASEVVVAEQAVARELDLAMQRLLPIA